MEKKIFRTVLQVEILSDTPYHYSHLRQAGDDIIEGDCSGKVEVLSENEELNGAQAVDAIVSQGTDPSFFEMTHTGESIMDEDEEIFLADLTHTILSNEQSRI